MGTRYVLPFRSHMGTRYVLSFRSHMGTRFVLSFRSHMGTRFVLSFRSHMGTRFVLSFRSHMGTRYVLPFRSHMGTRFVLPFRSHMCCPNYCWQPFRELPQPYARIAFFGLDRQLYYGSTDLSKGTIKIMNLIEAPPTGSNNLKATHLSTKETTYINFLGVAKFNYCILIRVE